MQYSAFIEPLKTKFAYSYGKSLVKNDIQGYNRVEFSRTPKIIITEYKYDS